MQKTGLKTFVCSFVLSLFMIFSINGVFWRVSPPQSREIKLPNKNIMLFINNNLTSPSTRPAPVKKIALSMLEEQKSAQPEPQPVEKSPQIIKADVFDEMEMIEIPLEIIPTVEEFRPQIKKVAQNAETAPPKPQKTVNDKIEIIPSPPAIKLAQVGADIPLEVSRVETVKPQDNAVIRVSDPKEDEYKPIYLLPKPTPKTEPIKIAQEDGPKSLIPLQHSGGTIGLDNQAKVINSAEPNQVALANALIPIKSMAENDGLAKKDIMLAKKAEKWQKMAAIDDKKADSPWVVATSNNKTQNNMLLQEKYFNKDVADIKAALKQPEAAQSDDETLLASETIKNLLIPIPEDILNDENLTPRLVSSKKPEEIKKEAEVDAEMAAVKKAKPEKVESGLTMKKIEEPVKFENAIPMLGASAPKENSAKKNILTSLGSIFTSTKDSKTTSKTDEKTTGLVQDFKNKFKTKKAREKIMPTEMRLSFQPNRAEISGQTLRWIQAFATKTAEDKTLVLEIRIDGTGAMELQQKRLNLLHNILTNRGVEYSKINTVFTNREPNSFIIRTLKINNSGTMRNGNNNQEDARYHMQW